MGSGTFRLGQRAALDGVRALAVLTVIAYHYSNAALPFRGGAFGVDVFFVLSGFLITALLVEEFERSNAISFGKFYARRTLRLLPALFLFLLVAAVLAVVAGSHERQDLFQIAASATYWLNWLWALSPGSFLSFSSTGHLWSLAVEEQFYLLWPLLLVVALRYWRLRGVLVLALVLACASVVARAGLDAIGAVAARTTYGTDTRASALMVGAILAIGLKTFRPRRPPRALLWGALMISGLFLMFVRVESGMTTRGGGALFALAVAVVLWDLTTGESLLQRALSLSPVVWVGRLSYGLYLWHWGVIVWLSEQTSWRTSAMIGLPLTFACASVSYYAVERPFLRLKGRFTAGTAESRPHPEPKPAVATATPFLQAAPVAQTSGSPP